jgi:hypothetical protein
MRKSTGVSIAKILAGVPYRWLYLFLGESVEMPT